MTAITPHPLRGRILVHQDPAETMFGGLHLPEGSEIYDNIATVVEVGPGLEHLDVAIGDRVLFSRQANSALIPDRRVLAELYGLPEIFKELLMLKEGNVHMVVTNENAPGILQA